jgi:hypothetical protein
MTELVKYNAARAALIAARSVDEVKDIRDKAVALQAYARQANDFSLIDSATDIRLRAERRAGELLREMATSGARAQIGGDRRSADRPKLPTLSSINITNKQSCNWQRLARLSDDEFEAKVSEAKRKFTKSCEVREQFVDRAPNAKSAGSLRRVKEFLITGSGPVGRIRYSQLDRLISIRKIELSLLQEIRDAGRPIDRNATIDDLFEEREIQEMVARISKGAA